MRLTDLVEALDGLLQPASFRDYCPNGLQVEGRPEVTRVLCGVTANVDLVERAIAGGYDAILVHHGFFWRGEDPTLTAWRLRRLRPLLVHEVSLIAYHLPLDAHPEVGNNAVWARTMGWRAEGRCGKEELVWLGRPEEPTTLAELASRLNAVLDRAPLVLGEPQRRIERLAWCSGAAQGEFAAVIDEGVDVYVTGEVSEPCVHLARDAGVAFIAAGHHATERFGVQALGRWLAQEHGLEVDYHEIPSPV
ncbi:Nif3-like dinuclear metal center hexameric protein [Tepidiphilus margaritifer]|uniref:Nif3-like dinuclear metal center hexameric protein n=1 Tax=Tepidiphilus margaritifer TaxID=203471 RepID=UPI0004038FE8|nr:Nif3-like dinuclear metal center hexameric protein [Tepidiphilus margaritifer]